MAQARASGPLTLCCPHVGNEEPSWAGSHGYNPPQTLGSPGTLGFLKTGETEARLSPCRAESVFLIVLLLGLFLLTEAYISQAGKKTGRIYLKKNKKKLTLYSQKDTFERVRIFLQLAV